MRRRALVGAICAALAGACSRAEPAASLAAQPLHIGIDLWPGYYPALLADELGFFRAEGVQVECSIPEDTDQLLVDFAAGSFDGVAVAMGDTINLLEADPDIRAVLLSDVSDGADMVLALPPITRPEDLRGKAVGTNLGGFGEVLVRQMFDSHGVPAADVQLRNVDAAQAVDRLASGELAAVHTWEPYASRAKALGAHVLYTSHDADGIVVDGFVFSGALVRARPEAVKGFVRAFFRAEEHWQAHRQADDEVLAKRLGVPVAAVQLTGIRLLARGDQADAFRAGSSNRSVRHVLQQFVEYYVNRGTLSSVPNLDHVLDPSFIAAGP